MKRLFFGIEVKAPWPSKFPVGRILEEEHRHLTLAFLGHIDYSQLLEVFASFPAPSFKVGFVGKFDQCLFLPPKHPRVVAWHIAWFEENSAFTRFYDALTHWLQKSGFSLDLHHDFTPHLTISRSPFNKKAWRKTFTPLPCLLKDIHLYESLGHSKYQSLWSYPLFPPFEEIDHTADIAFHVYGETLDQLFQNAQVALAFTFPLFLDFFSQKKGFTSLEEIVIGLNNVVSYADKEIGCPFKAVSFHGQIKKIDHALQWEMIIDV